MNDAKMNRFRNEVMALDEKPAFLMQYERMATNRVQRNVICCNPWCSKPAERFQERGYYEVAHLEGKGRAPARRFDPSNGIRFCWWCHDLVDGRHNEMWPELTSDERMVKILDWWEENRPEHYKMRGWAKAHDKLRASVARRTRSKE